MKPGLNSTQLKLIACLSMLIDHIGLLLFPGQLWLRALGRLAFPIFCYTLAVGFHHTRDSGRYLLRLSVFALAFQPVYAYCMPRAGWNIFATLGLGLFALCCCRLWRSRPLAAGLGLIVSLLAAFLLPLDYGPYGLLMIIAAGLFRERRLELSLAWLALGLAEVLSGGHYLQLLALAALPLIWLDNGQRGWGGKWFFYAFYCLHIPLLYWISTLMG